jgi:outer membrane autotransporter protein
LGSAGIFATGTTGTTIRSTTVTTTGVGSTGIFGRSTTGPLSIASANVTTGGANSVGIQTRTTTGANNVTSTGTVRTSGANSAGIDAASTTGAITIASNAVATTGNGARGISAVSTSGAVGVTSTGAVTTAGTASDGIYVKSGGPVSVTASTVTTTGANSAGIRAIGSTVSTSPTGSGITALALPLANPPAVTITSGSVTTSGANSPGVSGTTAAGDVVITSTGTVTTTGANSPGVLGSTGSGSVTVDSNSAVVTGAGSDAIQVNSTTASTVTIHGLTSATNGFAVQANGGPATVNNTSTGTIRGNIDLTDSNDTVNNAGLFDAIGNSAFGGGTDVFNNSGTLKATGGTTTFTGLETFNNSGLIDLRDGAPNDTLILSGTAFNGSGSSHLGLDVDYPNGVADKLVTGLANGSTLIDLNITNRFTFNFNGILLVDASVGSSSTAFSLTGGNVTNGFIRSVLRYNAANGDFLLFGLPDAAVFEGSRVASIADNAWYESADAIAAQLDTARDGAGRHNARRSWNVWGQIWAGRTDRKGSQSITVAGVTDTFDTGFRQSYEGVQAGIDHQSGGVIFGVTLGAGNSDARFFASAHQTKLDIKNAGLYAQINSGGFFLNGLAKMDWMDVSNDPGTGFGANFNAQVFGVQANAGYRWSSTGGFYAEPSVGLSWVNTDIDDYSVGGLASVTFQSSDSVRARAGLRLGADLPTGGGGTLSPFVSANGFKELGNDNHATFDIGQNFLLTDLKPRTHGEVGAGAAFTTGRVEAFLRGEVDFGKDYKGRAVRAGVRVRF